MSFQAIIRPGQRCVYIGPGEGHGVGHRITSVMSDEAGMIEITTWGDSFRATGGGDTWAGPLGEFAKQFRPAQDNK